MKALPLSGLHCQPCGRPNTRNARRHDEARTAEHNWSTTVYISPVHDLGQQRARCKVANPDWTCRYVGQPLSDSNGDPVYEWSFSEPP